MVDPTGIVSLGLTGVGKATSVVRHRKKHRKVVKRLAAHMEAADLKLRNAGANVESCRAILTPLIDEAAALLQRFAAQKPLQSLNSALEEEPDDIEAAKKLIDAFKAADSAIELHCSLRRLDERLGDGNELTLVTIQSLQRDVARLEKTVHRCGLCDRWLIAGRQGA
ncbi:hypothetical protein AURDEDRAFT_113860 [Auricularia subglabra TFB-10046 SS5]|nr:hypothetical protein AURDEDRAFT_113860 [Auricularia subglabra TFB-10046 SS5]